MATLQALSGTGVSSPDSEKAPLAILVAEDSTITRGLLKLLLSQRGHEVDTVEDGAAAIDAMRVRDYDIALVDFHLPTMDGLEVVSAYREEAGDAASSTRFIGITADVSGFMARPDSWDTFDLVIAKPIDVTNLCSAVEDFERYMAWRSPRSIGTGAASATPVILAEEGSSETVESTATSLAEGFHPQRRDKRVKIDRGSTQLELEDGQVYPCRVINLSLSGAALEIEERPPVGERVRVGRTEGRVVRHTSEGIAVEFSSAK